MMCEEFVRISKVDVTGKFYRESIEPQYMEAKVDKEVFVEQWLKDNKANIVKAHAFDIDRSSRELALADIKIAELEDVKAENSQLQYQAETWQAKFKAANSSLEIEKLMAETLKSDYHEAMKLVSELEPLEIKVIELESQIVFLKARLFDMMEAK